MDNIFKQANSILSDVEKSKIIAFNADKEMSAAVKKVILMEVYFNGTLTDDSVVNPLRNFTLSLASSAYDFSNEIVGQKLRARWEGINLLETGFDTLERFKAEVASPFQNEVENPAV